MYSNKYKLLFYNCSIISVIICFSYVNIIQIYAIVILLFSLNTNLVVVTNNLDLFVTKISTTPHAFTINLAQYSHEVANNKCILGIDDPTFECGEYNRDNQCRTHFIASLCIHHGRYDQRTTDKDLRAISR